MNTKTLDQSLIAATPQGVAGNAQFINTVMVRIESQKFVINPQVLRNMNEQHNKGGSFMSKLRSLPVGALVALAITVFAATGGVAYAAYKYLWEPLQVKQGATLVGQDSVKAIFSLAGCPSYDGVLQKGITAEVKKRSGISPEEARKNMLSPVASVMLLKTTYMSSLPLRA